MTKALLLAAILVLPAVLVLAGGGDPTSFSPWVDDKGNITLPEDYRTTWIYLGSWVATSNAPQAQKGPGTGLHDAYSQPESVKAYKKDGRWPDGAVLVQEIRPILWDDLPTGHEMYAGDTTKWFVMVRDWKNRFKDNPNWGDGWGWALLMPSDPKKNVSTNYKNDCRSCHEVAMDTDWVFVQGYPTLR